MRRRSSVSALLRYSPTIWRTWLAYDTGTNINGGCNRIESRSFRGYR